MMLRRFGSTFRHLVRDERGNVLALTAVGLPILLGCAALAVDTAQWVFAKRELQAAADAAAIAGVYGLIQTGDMETAVDRSIASDNHLDPTRAVTAEKSPDAFKDDPFAVRVRIASAAKMTSSAARSAAVTGELSLFASTSNPRRTTSRIAAPASRAASARSSRRRSEAMLSAAPCECHRPSVRRQRSYRDSRS